MPRKQNNELRELMSVGPKTLQNLTLLGIETVEQLSEEDPDRLYLKINEITEMKHDPCVWDIFAAIIDEAKTGNKKPWWEWTKVRKICQREGSFCVSQDTLLQD